MSEERAKVFARGEEFLKFFSRGMEFTKELLRENEKIRRELGQLRTQQHAAARNPEEWEKHHHGRGDPGKGARVGRAFGWLIGIASVGALGYGGLAYYRRRVQGGSFDSGFGDDARREGYAPMNAFADPEFDDFESPLEVPTEPPRAAGDAA